MHSAVFTFALTAGFVLPAAAETSQGAEDGQMQTMDHSKWRVCSPLSNHKPKAGLRYRQLTDADRAAVYKSPGGHAVHDTALNSLFIFEKLEWQDADNGSALNWDAQGWIGGDIDRLWLRSEGERTNGKTKKAEVQALWGHSISPWWDLVAGARQDFKPGDLKRGRLSVSRAWRSTISRLRLLLIWVKAARPLLGWKGTTTSS